MCIFLRTNTTSFMFHAYGKIVFIPQGNVPFRVHRLVTYNLLALILFAAFQCKCFVAKIKYITTEEDTLVKLVISFR